MIVKIKNIFTNQIRKKLIEDCKPLIVDGKELMRFYNMSACPSKQSHPTVHMHPKFVSAHDHIKKLVEDKLNSKMKIEKSWVVLTTGKKEDIYWHSHESDISCVYYMKTHTPFDSGTNFRDGFVRAEQNSLLIFPSSLEHAPPLSLFRFKRYTMAMEMNYE